MSATLPARLAALVARARQRRSPRPVLVSASEELPPVDPLALLGAAADAAQGDAALTSLLAGGRMFWARPADRVALAGLGAAVTLAPSGATRFQVADRAWRHLLESLVTDDDAPLGAPVLLGGFSFDPAGPASDAWRAFPSTHLFVPALQLRGAPEGHRLTLSTLLRPDGTSSVSAAELQRLYDLARGDAQYDAPPARDAEPVGELAYAPLRPADEWRALVRDAVHEIRGGAMEKVVLARAERAALPEPLDVLALLRHLRATYEEGYVFGCWRGDAVFAGASPERLVRLRDGAVDASSLAGSIRRGAMPEEDHALAGQLLASAKDLAEHAMVRTALRDALGTLCDDVTSRDEPSLLSLPNVHHLHTAVRATLREGQSFLGLVGALHPTPAVGGTPRAGALRFIAKREQLDRGWYAAPVGWVGRDAGEMAVGLRSALLTDRDATLYAGCGIVADSEPETELAESRVKLRAMQSALAATAAESPAASRA